MSRRIIAIYENGVLRPLAPLDMPEHTRVEVEIEVEAAAEVRAAHAVAVRAALRRSGTSLSPLALADHPPASPADGRREELARVFAGERPLSDYISADRDGRDF